MEAKKIVALLIPLFIAMIFISAYISNANYSTPSAPTTTIPQTVFGQGVTNGIIHSYGSPISISVSCSNSLYSNSIASNLTSTLLTKLENNNSIFDFYNTGLEYSVAIGNASSYSVYSFFHKNVNSTEFGCLNFTGPAYVQVPSVVNFTVGTQKVGILINSSYRNSTITLPMSDAVGSQLRLKVSALITANGTIYGPLGVTVIQ